MKTWTFADIARHWDATLDYDDVNAGTDSYFRRFIDSAPLFTLPTGGAILDIDCRTAKGTAFFAKKYPSARFTCVAMSPLFASIAHDELLRQSIPADVHILTGLPLPFPPTAFDAILTYETLEHVPQPEQYLRELQRLAKPGALLVLTTPNRLWEPIHWLAPKLGLHHSEGPHRMLPRKEIRVLLRITGWRIVTEKTFILIPAGPRWLLQWGIRFERLLPEWCMRTIGLRRTFICRKHG